MQGQPAMRGLKGKAAIVTGAAQGIGKAIAERLSEEGVDVLWADIDEQRVQEAQEGSDGGVSMKVIASYMSQISTDLHCQTGMTGLQGCRLAQQPLRRLRSLQVDISKESEVEHMVSVAVEVFGRLDILINNAARFVFASATDITDEGIMAFHQILWHVAGCKSSPATAACSNHVSSLRCITAATMRADWDQVLGTNVRGTSFATKHAARAMVAAKTAGAIVNIASTSAFVAQPGFVPYSTSKGAILQMTRVSALDLGKAGIR